MLQPTLCIFTILECFEIIDKGSTRENMGQTIWVEPDFGLKILVKQIKG